MNEIIEKDKYAATWVSYSSIHDFLRCPRSYFLKNIYRNPKTGHKIKIINPPLALGQSVHEIIDSLSTLPIKKRFIGSLVEKYDSIWHKYSGKKGGFINKTIEHTYKKQGEEMLLRLSKNPGPLARLAVKIQNTLPYFWLSEKDEIILCGKIDWLEYLPETGSVHIIDFKTSKANEELNSLQLPIYYLLAVNCQKRPVTQASYWYLARDEEPTKQPLPIFKESYKKILDIAKQIKIARQLARFKCPKGETGCTFCLPYEHVLQNKAEFVTTNDYKEDVYILSNKNENDVEDDSIIL